jgi:hypothetical protein
LKHLTQQSSRKEIKKFSNEKQLRYWLAEDFVNFVQYCNFFNNHKTGKIQIEIARAMTSGHSSVLINAFRNSSKTYLSDLWILYRLHRYPQQTCSIISSTEGNAAKHLYNIRNFTQNIPALRYMTWARMSETSARFANSLQPDPTISCYGIDAKSTGSRCDFILLDDCEVPQNVETEALRTKLIKRYEEVSMFVHEPCGRFCKDKDNIPLPEKTTMIWIGTPHSEFSTYFPPQDDEPHPLKDAHVIRIPAIIDGQSAFPEKWSRAQLEILRTRKYSKPAWALQYLLDPSAYDKESNVLDMDKILKVKNLSITDVTMTVDPRGESASKGTDEAAICIGGLAANNKVQVHIKHIKGYRNIDANKFVDEALSMAAKNGVERILVEDNFSAYVTLFRNRIEKMGNFATVEPIHASQRKADRLVQSLDANVNGQRVSFEEDVFADKDTYKQFASWRYSALPSNDDRLDVTAMLIAYFQPMLEHSDEFKWDSASMDD